MTPTERSDRMMAAADVVLLEVMAYFDHPLTDMDRQLFKLAFARGAVYGASEAKGMIDAKGAGE